MMPGQRPSGCFIANPVQIIRSLLTETIADQMRTEGHDHLRVLLLLELQFQFAFEVQNKYDMSHDQFLPSAPRREGLVTQIVLLLLKTL